MSTTRTSGGLGPDEHGAEHDRFARVVDGGLRGFSDSELDRDLAVVAALRQAGTRVRPAPQERDRMRQRIMAEFSPVVHEGNSPVLMLRPSRRRRRASVPEDPRSRFMVAAAAALCLVMSLSGMSLLLSRDAVPGDALYTFKRSAETAELGLTFGDERKALKHLEFADSRVSEIEALAQHADATGSWSQGQDRFLRALNDFDSDTAAGTRLITTLASEGQAEVLPPMREWVEQHDTRLRAVRGALPLATATRLDSTLELLDRVNTRITALDQRSICDTIASTAQDDLGPLPARGACVSDEAIGMSSAAPLPEGTGPLGTDSENSLMPPDLLTTPPEEPASEEADTENDGPLRLPSPSDGVLTNPGDVTGGEGNDPEGEDRPRPLRDLLTERPENQGIPLLPLLTPDE